MKENEYIPLDTCKYSTEFDVCQGLYNIYFSFGVKKPLTLNSPKLLFSDLSFINM